jgi:hypothetical protein
MESNRSSPSQLRRSPQLERQKTKTLVLLKQKLLTNETFVAAFKRIRQAKEELEAKASKHVETAQRDGRKLLVALVIEIVCG